MKVEDYIFKLATLKQELGLPIQVTPEEAVDIYQLEGIIPDCVDWRYDELNACIWLDGIPAIFNVPEGGEWCLAELWHNVAVYYRLNKNYHRWE